MMNKEYHVAQSGEGLTQDNQEQLLALFHDSKKQTQLLMNQVQNQNTYNRLILLIVLSSIAIIFFFAFKIFKEISKKNPADNSLGEVVAVYEKLHERFKGQLKDLQVAFNLKAEQMTAENNKEKDLLIQQMKENSKSIILAMDSARRIAEETAQRYQRQIAEYETTISTQKKELASITNDIAQLQNEYSDLKNKHNKILAENKKLSELNKELEKRLLPYLSPQEHVELQKKKRKDD